MNVVTLRSLIEKEKLNDSDFLGELEAYHQAFDSVRWDYLNDVLNKFGFGVKWRKWIKGCLSSSMGSILINGSRSTEFKFCKGLKQGDPLSPFLFLLIVESLHISFNKVVQAGFYKGFHIDDSLTLSHLFYADDVVFVGKWDKQNVTTIVNVLKYFFLASGLKINLHESKLPGIGIPHVEVRSAAESIGCSTLVYPFNFLGVKVGGLMSRHGKLALIGWQKVLASKKNNDLGAMYGERGALDSLQAVSSCSSPWTDIIREFKRLSLKGIDLFLLKKVGNGEDTSFWEDCWLSEVPLKLTYPRLFSLELDKNISIADKMRDTSLISSFRRVPRGGIEEDQVIRLRNSLTNVILSQSLDRWVWTLESSGDFSVKSARFFY
ncbi:RNA-directed DNA polymerase, eukaryota [Tanacetum coccineum]|uniref:RNA-directed DNA polymerase, eukaryota n=1 Tax=Tanacetum coccineum TaxID=301880 RepID=A0ABQ5BAM8_9ASTR